MERFQLKPTIFFGSDALAALEGLAGRRVMVITDSFLAQSGLLERVRARLRDCTVEVFDQVVPDPPLELVAQGARALAVLRSKPQLLVAIPVIGRMVEYGFQIEVNGTGDACGHIIVKLLEKYNIGNVTSSFFPMISSVLK